MGKSVFIVLHNAVPDEDAALQKWYNDVHIPETLRVAPRFVAASRYQFSDVELLPGLGLTGHRYLTVYEVDGDTSAELTQAAESLRTVFFGGASPQVDAARAQSTNGDAISPALDLASISASFAVCILDRVGKEDVR